MKARTREKNSLAHLDGTSHLTSPLLHGHAVCIPKAVASYVSVTQIQRLQQPTSTRSSILSCSLMLSLAAPRRSSTSSMSSPSSPSSSMMSISPADVRLDGFWAALLHNHHVVVAVRPGISSQATESEPSSSAVPPSVSQPFLVSCLFFLSCPLCPSPRRDAVMNWVGMATGSLILSSTFSPPEILRG